MTEQSIGFIFTPPRSGGHAGKLADAELHFLEGPLAGLKLEGFSVWTSKFTDRGPGVNVMVPSRAGKAGSGPNGKTPYYDTLRCTDPEDRKALWAFKDLAGAAYVQWRDSSGAGQNGQAPEAQGFGLDGGVAPAELGADDIPFTWLLPLVLPVVGLLGVVMG